MQSVGSQASPGWSQLSPVVSFFDHILDDAMHLGVVLIRRCLIEWPRLLPPACSGNLRSPFCLIIFRVRRHGISRPHENTESSLNSQDNRDDCKASAVPYRGPPCPCSCSLSVWSSRLWSLRVFRFVSLEREHGRRAGCRRRHARRHNSSSRQW